ncbi:hypothetical protein TNCV_1299651 [Trichonephila clavipes]|nr:hypothetical protein TNCV_1299651 [Trichonephila clavipes]
MGTIYHGTDHKSNGRRNTATSFFIAGGSYSSPMKRSEPGSAFLRFNTNEMVINYIQLHRLGKEARAVVPVFVITITHMVRVRRFFA